MVDISRPPLYTSDSRKRYKRDEAREGPCDDDFGGGPYAAYDAYRKTSASLFGNPSVSGPCRRRLMPHSLIDVLGYLWLIYLRLRSTK